MSRALPALLICSDRVSACCANRFGNTWLQHAPGQQTRLHSSDSSSSSINSNRNSNSSSSSSAHSAHQEQPGSLTSNPEISGSAGPPPPETLAGGSQQRVFVNPELLAHISSTINRLTGYAGIEHLKSGVGATDTALQDSKRQMQAAKAEYEAQLAKQSQLHREVTSLLQRKSSWVAADVARFTELYAAEHATETAVGAAKARYSRLSDEVEQLQLTLMDLIRERYQQEQLWSDKIRRASTWWTWGLMGLHFASFVLVYTVLEPRKRQALQDAVAGMLQAQAADLDIRLAPLALAVTAAMAETELQHGNGNGDSGGGNGQQQLAAAEQGAVAGRPEQRQAAGSCGVTTPRRERRQQQQQPSEQIVLQELRRVQHQLQQLQQSLPGIAAAAASGAAADVQTQQQRRPWHIPGSGWAAQQVVAAGASAKAVWQRTREGVQQVLLVRQASQAGHGSGPGLDNAGQALPASAEPAAAAGGPAVGEPLEAAATAGSGGPGTGRLPQAALKQLQAGDGVLEVSRGQLAALAGSAFAAGAGAAAVLLLLLSGSKG